MRDPAEVIDFNTLGTNEGEQSKILNLVLQNANICSPCSITIFCFIKTVYNSIHVNLLQLKCNTEQIYLDPKLLRTF